MSICIDGPRKGLELSPEYTSRIVKFPAPKEIDWNEPFRFVIYGGGAYPIEKTLYDIDVYERDEDGNYRYTGRVVE